MDVLEKIFGSAAKVKLMRLFLFNTNIYYDLDSVVSRAKVTPESARRELKTLEEACLIKRKSFLKESIKKVGKKKIVKRKRVPGWILNDNFHYIAPLQSFLIHLSPLQDKDIIRRFSRAGKIKLLVIAGVFIQEPESRVDLLVVGDNLRKGTIENAVKDIEAELGKELAYSVFETKDFNYRLGMYDKLLRDVLDYSHKKLVNKLGI